MEASWATAAGRALAVTCKRTWDSDSGNRRDFQIGVAGDRWIQPHLAVRTWFVADRWDCFCDSARVGLLLFGLPLGFFHLIDLGVLNLLEFVGFGTSMMKGLDRLARMML